MNRNSRVHASLLVRRMNLSIAMEYEKNEHEHIDRSLRCSKRLLAIWNLNQLNTNQMNIRDDVALLL